MRVITYNDRISYMKDVVQLTNEGWEILSTSSGEYMNRDRAVQWFHAILVKR